MPEEPRDRRAVVRHYRAAVAGMAKHHEPDRRLGGPPATGPAIPAAAMVTAAASLAAAGVAALCYRAEHAGDQDAIAALAEIADIALGRA